MPETVETTELSPADRERRAQRTLGAIENELKHLKVQVAEDTATIRELKDERRFTKQKFDALERDLSAVAKGAKEASSTFSASIAQLTQRLERLEAAAAGEKVTKPPKRVGGTPEDRRQPAVQAGRREGGNPPNYLDSLF